MNPRLNALATLMARAFRSTTQLIHSRMGLLVGTAAVAVGGYWLAVHPPVQSVGRGEVVVRSNALTGDASLHHEGSLFAFPALHDVRRFSLRDQVYRPVDSAKADGDAPFQSVEGLSLGVDLAVRYAIDPTRVVAISKNLPEDIGAEVVRPAVQGVIYKTFTRYTVREIFSSKRADIQAQIEAELKPRLAADGILLRTVQMGQVDLPAEYRAGLDGLLAQELETAKMRYTLELKAKQVEQTALEGEAQRVRREKAAQASAQEQIIAA